MRARSVLVTNITVGILYILSRFQRVLVWDWHPVRAADDEHGDIEHLQYPLRLGGEVNVAGCVKQRCFVLPQLHYRLTGEYGYPP